MDADQPAAPVAAPVEPLVVAEAVIEDIVADIVALDAKVTQLLGSPVLCAIPAL